MSTVMPLPAAACSRAIAPTDPGELLHRSGQSPVHGSILGSDVSADATARPSSSLFTLTMPVKGRCTVVAMTHRFESVDAVREGLRSVDYLADESIAGITYLADRLGKPVLIEGPAGTGKTQLAKSVAEMSGARLIRLQCYEGLDEAKALYEWNYKKQLLRIQVEKGDEDASWADIQDDIFSDEFLLPRPLLEAITADDPVVLLIDEVDRVELETEALLLEILSDYQVSIPELGTIESKQIPLVFLTSNNTRELSEALKRRCLFLHLDYPEMEREKEIVLTKVPDISDSLAEQVARIVRSVRQLELKKHPSVSETLDWARTLVLLGIDKRRRGSRRGQHRQHPVEVPVRHREGHQGLLVELGPVRGPTAGLGGVSTVQSGPTEPDQALTEQAEPQSDRQPGRHDAPSTTTDGSESDDPLFHLLEGFVTELRTAGLPVSLSENIDAAEAVKHIPLEDRVWRSSTPWPPPWSRTTPTGRRSRPCSRSTSPSGARSTPSIPTPTTPSVTLTSTTRTRWPSRPPGDNGQGQGGGDGMSPEELAELLYQALMRGDDTLMRAIARQAVKRYRRDGARPAGRRYLLPVPDAAEPRPRRGPGTADGPGQAE